MFKSIESFAKKGPAHITSHLETSGVNTRIELGRGENKEIEEAIVLETAPKIDVPSVISTPPSFEDRAIEVLSELRSKNVITEYELASLSARLSSYCSQDVNDPSMDDVEFDDNPIFNKPAINKEWRRAWTPKEEIATNPPPPKQEPPSTTRATRNIQPRRISIETSGAGLSSTLESMMSAIPSVFSFVPTSGVFLTPSSSPSTTTAVHDMKSTTL